MDRLFEFVSNHYFLVSSFVVVLVLFVANEMRRGGRSITAQEMVNLVNRDKAVVLDVRDKKEFADGHVVDAVNIPFASLESRADELRKFKDRPIVVMCKMGQHAGSAGALLRKAGYENVARLGGGMMEWRGASLPVVKGA